MRTGRMMMLVALVLACTLAMADGIRDPKIIIHGVQGGNSNGPLTRCPQKGCQNVGVNFTFSTPKNPRGVGALFFTNASGKNWTSLTLIYKDSRVPASAVVCSTNLFASCTTKTLEDGSVEIILAGNKHHGPNNPLQGIAAGSSFSIGFACINKTECWPPNVEFTAHAGTVPEPGTIALMATGVAALVSRRKKWLRKD